MIRKGQAFGSSSDGRAVSLHAFINPLFGFQA